MKVGLFGWLIERRCGFGRRSSTHQAQTVCSKLKGVLQDEQMHICVDAEVHKLREPEFRLKRETTASPHVDVQSNAPVQMRMSKCADVDLMMCTCGLAHVYINARRHRGPTKTTCFSPDQK